MNKKLYRSRKNKAIGGVAAGLAEYFDIDPTLVRIIFVVSLFMGGSGIIAYILLWIIVPEEPYPQFTSAAGTPSSEYTGTASTGNMGAAPGETPGQSSVSDKEPYETYLKLREEKKHKRLLFLGLALILAGLFFLAHNFIPHIHFTDFFSLILIAIGIGLLVNSKKLNIY